jgi:uncharacterized RDD family membrane protein YckC
VDTVDNPYAPPTAAVEDITVRIMRYELASPVVRLAASVLDYIIRSVAMVVPALIPIMVGIAAGVDEDAMDPYFGAAGLSGFIGFLIWTWLTIKFVSQTGQSIAKKILGIKVVRADGSPCSLGRIFWMRNVVNSLIGAMTFYIYTLVDVLFIFGDKNQCLHDKLADTIVIKA